MKHYKLTLSYDGTHYSGWQVQPNNQTIQETIQKALFVILRKTTNLTGSGRTDAGVHAIGQVAHFSSDESLDHYSFLYRLNGVLPKDIRALKLDEVDETFHARYSAKGKIYQYHISLGNAQNPCKRNYAHHITKPLSLELIKDAAKVFIGTHDFTSFANEANKGCASRKPVKTLKRIDIYPHGNELYFELESDGFLYKMVRNIAGALIEVGLNKISSDDIKNILIAKDRRKAPKTAPALGLFLKEVLY